MDVPFSISVDHLFCMVTVFLYSQDAFGSDNEDSIIFIIFRSAFPNKHQMFTYKYKEITDEKYVNCLWQKYMSLFLFIVSALRCELAVWEPGTHVSLQSMALSLQSQI